MDVSPCCMDVSPSCMDVSPCWILSSATTTLSPAFLTLLMNPAPVQPGSSGSPLPDKAAKNQGPWLLPYLGLPRNRLSSEESCTERSPLWSHTCNWAEGQLTHNELQLISQQIPQQALELRWPLRIIPNEGRGLGSYTPTWASSWPR